MKGEMKGRHGRPFGYREHFLSSSDGECSRWLSVKQSSKNNVGGRAGIITRCSYVCLLFWN